MDELKRHLAPHLKRLARQYPIVSVTGPRQSGKTTLVQHVFSKYKYVSLEDPDVREFALKDPRGFLQTYSSPAIFDEIQRVPELFSYLQSAVDKNRKAGQFILTGSQQFLLSEKISQTLVGRTAILRLLPLSLGELLGRKPQNTWLKSRPSFSPKYVTVPSSNLNHYLFSGLYPAIHKNKLSPKQFYRDYVDTYITKDLRSIVNVGDLVTFQKFLRMLAARSGQKLNLTSLGNDLGVSHTTIKSWLGALEASYIIHVLSPHFANFNKRLTKTPKIFFLDVGLLCYLLRVQNENDLNNHPFIGAIFETFVFGELYKVFANACEDTPLYFWQNQTGNEIDFIIDHGRTLIPIEVKSAQTVTEHFFKTLQYWLNLPDNQQKNGFLVYAGDTWQKRTNLQVVPWFGIS